MKSLKNLKIFNKKTLSLLTALMIGATPIAASASNYDDEEDVSFNEEVNYDDLFAGFALVEQEVEKNPLTVEEYVAGVKKAYTYLAQFINYDHMQEDVQCLYYLVNRDYIKEDVEELLISKGIIYPTSLENNEMQNFMHAINLLNVRADYNQSKIRIDYKNDGIYEDNLIDLSKFCFDEHDAKLVRNIFLDWVNAYKTGRFSTDNVYYKSAFKRLTNLNAMEGNGNVAELSVGARWIAQLGIGNDIMQMLRDDMQEDFPRSELDKYFVAGDLNKGQWTLRDDVSLDLNCLKNELEVEVFNFGELWYHVYTTVNNDIFKSFSDRNCKTK